MNSRDAVLGAVKQAVQKESGIKTNQCDVDDAILQQIDASCSHDPAVMIPWFKKEAERASGEVFIVQNVHEAVSVIHQIITAEAYQRIAVTSEPVCMEMAGQLKAADPSFDIVHALSIDADERKKCVESIPISLVCASYGVCDTGTLVFPYDDCGTSLPHFLSECVVAVVSSAVLVPTQFHLFQSMASEKAGNMVFVTGPSRTADIEKVLILGAHGPRRLVVLLFPESKYCSGCLSYLGF